MSKLSVFLTNAGKYAEGALVGTFVRLPIESPKELQQALKDIGIGKEYEEYFITDYESSFVGLRDILGEYESIEALNELAEILEALSNDDEDKLNAILECESCKSIDELKELIESLDDYDLLPDIDDDEDLGYYYIEDCGIFPDIPECIRNYIDYEKFGRDVRLEGSIVYSSYGAVIHNE